MNIQDNILKYHLKNVYFICGTACAGKTTMSKILAEKHGFYLYDMDKEYSFILIILLSYHNEFTT